MLIVNRSTTMCRCRDVVTESGFHFVMLVNASFHVSVFLFLVAAPQTILIFFSAQIQFVFLFCWYSIWIRLLCVRSVHCIVLESDVVWYVMWCGERNFNRRCLSLHIGHDQIVIYIHSKRSASRASSTQSTNFLSLVHPSVHKWIRRRY